MHSCEHLSDVPVEVLCRLLREQGPGLLRAGGRCGAILADMCGAYRQEVFILDSVIRKGLFAAKPQAGIPLDAARYKFAQQISDQLRFDTEAARWAASAWASLYEVSLISQAANNEPRARSSCASGGLHTAQSIGAMQQVIAGVVRAFRNDLGEVHCLDNLHQGLVATVARESSPASDDILIATILVPSFSSVDRGLVLTERMIHFVNLNSDGQPLLVSWPFRELQASALHKPRLGCVSLGAAFGVVDLAGTGVQTRTLLTFLAVIREVIAPFIDAMPATNPPKPPAKPTRRART